MLKTDQQKTRKGLQICRNHCLYNTINRACACVWPTRLYSVVVSFNGLFRQVTPVDNGFVLSQTVKGTRVAKDNYIAFMVC